MTRSKKVLISSEDVYCVSCSAPLASMEPKKASPERPLVQLNINILVGRVLGNIFLLAATIKRGEILLTLHPVS